MTDEKKPEDTNNGEAPAEEAPAESVEPDSVEAAAASELAEALDERTRDLQRVTAEYHNYRKRVDRDRQAAADQATANVMTGLLPVLDDIDRARDHGDLVGPFGSVAEQLLNTLNKLGLETFGDKGDTFDPMVHEAVAHMHSDDVAEPTCIDVMRRGYRLGDRLVRAAMVAVAEPSEEATASAAVPELGDDATEKAPDGNEQASAESSTDAEPADEGSTEEASTDGTGIDQPVDVTETTGEKSTGSTTENLDADVPDDEEALKGEVVENAVAEASDADEAAPEEDDAAEETASDEGGNAKSDGATDDGSDDKK